MPQHVLVPIDGSDYGFAALEYSLTSFPDASVTALYVVDITHDHTATVGSTESPTDRAEEHGENVLDRAVDRAADHEYDRELQTFLRTGTPHAEILSVVTEHDVDHVVLGSHSETSLTHPFLGRVSEAIVRRAPVSTTVVPEPSAAVRERDLPGKILVPVDGSEQAEGALAYALEAFPNGTHTVLNVVSLPFDRSHEAVEGTYLEELVETLEGRAEEILDSAKSVADDSGSTIETATVAGKPAAGIVDFAEENGYDQIVMGSHGRSLAARLITGSVAEQVVRRSPRTVTLVRGSP
ncbi:universal stress protein [Natronoglomus mannanivorans]|uniref:Universal stress protein n=1 Tax=Natronoglomus mannanivorans TaxID=2979990 RepID=A0AAP2Z4T9_9EURY|nr:universal stress protein [Halobacteria archaeon AArc-xg1-1]